MSSDFFALTGYSVLNLQREYSQGNQIKTYLFERLKTEKIAASTRKKAERKNVTFRFGRCQSTPPIMWTKCTNNEFEFLKLQNILQIEKKKQTS